MKIQEFMITGNCPSKSNCYKVIKLGSKCSLGKQKHLKSYENSFMLQMLQYKYDLIDTEFKFIIDVYYNSRRPDLDNALKTHDNYYLNFNNILKDAITDKRVFSFENDVLLEGKNNFEYSWKNIQNDFQKELNSLHMTSSAKKAIFKLILTQTKSDNLVNKAFAEALKNSKGEDRKQLRGYFKYHNPYFLENQTMSDLSKLATDYFYNFVLEKDF